MSNKNERRTPPEIFAALKLSFDLDPCGMEDQTFDDVPARKVYTRADDGLSRPWEGLVWLNCPWHGRHAQVPWLERFIAHGAGAGIVLAYTSSDWFQDLMPCMDGLLLPRGKTRYLKADRTREGNPTMGSVLFSMGELATAALRLSGQGLFLPLEQSIPMTVSGEVP